MNRDSEPTKKWNQPPNKGHTGTSHFVHYRDSSWRSKNVWEMIILGHYELSFLERLSSSQRVLFHCIMPSRLGEVVLFSKVLEDCFYNYGFETLLTVLSRDVNLLADAYCYRVPHQTKIQD